MIVKLEDLPSGNHQFKGQFKINIEDVGLSVKTGDIIFYDIVIVVSEAKIKISGSSKIELDCVCDLCTKRFYAQHSCSIDESISILAEDSGISPASRLNEIDCEKMLYELLIVNIPLKILCKSDCKGLCSGCGVDQNITRCKCEQEMDSRWIKLKELKLMEEEIVNNGSS